MPDHFPWVCEASPLATESRFIPPGLGWQRDLPDPRDFTPDHDDIAEIFADLQIGEAALPPSVDLRKDDEGVYLSSPESQGRLNASSAFACVALVEYFERRALGHTFEGSPLFVYQMARRLAGADGNASLAIRTTLKALRRYGAPPADMRPYTDDLPDQLPADISLLGYSKDLAGMVYFRIDSAGDAGSRTLLRLKSFLAARFPVVFGFPVPHSLTHRAEIPFRPDYDSYRGGQSVLAVGYDDQRLTGKRGAVLIRSSWGPSWGEFGYGWLPYASIKYRQTADMWTVISRPWARSKELYLPLNVEHD